MFKIDLGRDKIMGIHVRCVIRQLTKEWNTRIVAIGMISSKMFFNPRQVRVFGSTMAISG